MSRPPVAGVLSTHTESLGVGTPTASAETRDAFGHAEAAMRWSKDDD